MSLLIQKNNLIASMATTKIFLNTKTEFHGDEVTDFYDK